jgi:DNA primase
VSTPKKKLEKTSLLYHRQFLNPPDGGAEIVTAGRGYLAAHGIDAKGIVEKYQIGVVINPAPGDERFAGMLSIPYLSKRGGVKAIKYRKLFGEGSKVAQYQNQPARLYNTNAWFTPGTAVGLTEGEADAICATERLSLPSMAVPGAEVWAAHEQVWKLCFRDVRVVFMLCDGDQPGKDLGRQVADSLGWRANVIDLPDGQDVSSLVASGHADWFDGKLDFTNDDEDE